MGPGEWMGRWLGRKIKRWLDGPGEEAEANRDLRGRLIDQQFEIHGLQMQLTLLQIQVDQLEERYRANGHMEWHTLQ